MGLYYCLYQSDTNNQNCNTTEEKYISDKEAERIEKQCDGHKNAQEKVNSWSHRRRRYDRTRRKCRVTHSDMLSESFQRFCQVGS